MTTPPPDAASAVFDRAVTELRAAPCLLSKRLAKRCAPVVVWHMDQCDALLSRLARAESALREAVGSEREACAKVAHAGSVAAFEQMANDSTDSINPSHTHADAMEAIGKALAECETIIRSRTALGAKGGGE